MFSCDSQSQYQSSLLAFGQRARVIASNSPRQSSGHGLLGVIAHYALVVFTMGALTAPAAAAISTATLPLAWQFAPNLGQWQPEILYWTRSAGVDALFMRDQVELRLRDTQASAVLRLRPLGANKAILQPGATRATVINDYRGQDPERWSSGIPTYEGLRYIGLYPKIDMAFRVQEQALAYDFILHPGADPARIRVAVEGARRLTLESDGSLRALLPGDLSFQQPAPLIYQERDGERELVSGQFRLLAEAESGEAENPVPVYGFEIGEYDPTRALIIDPTLAYASFVGGSKDESISAMHITSVGEAIVAGTTASADFAGLADPPGGEDGYIYKINASANALQFVTLFGGSGSDEINDLAVSRDGSLYITGSTSSEDLPLANPLFGVLTGRTDAFVAKLNANGSLANFSTYYGGNGTTEAKAIALDGDENIYVAGVTTASDLVLRDALQPTLAGRDDGFILRFSRNGRALEYATYFGGSANDSLDELIVSETGDLFLAGSTSSPATNRDGEQDFPIKNALQSTLGGRQDSFLARIARGGSELVFNTYLGGEGEDVLTDFARDSDGHYLISGYTSSGDWPTVNALIADYPAGGRNEMGTLAKIDKTGRFMHFATYLGATGSDRALAVAPGYRANGGGVIYVAGTTNSNAFPIKNPYQNYHAGEGDGFLMQLDPAGQAVEFSTYFGGSETDEIVAVEYHSPTDVVFFAGLTAEEKDMALFPLGTVASIASHAGGVDTFVARFDRIDRSPEAPALLLDTDLNPIHPEAPSTPRPELTFALRLQDRPATERGVIAFATKLYYDPEEIEFSGVSWGSGTVLDGLVDGLEKTVSGGAGELDLWVLQGRNPGRLDTGLVNDVIAYLQFNLVGVGGAAESSPKASKQVALHVQERASATIEGNLDAVIYGSSGSRFVERRCNGLLGDCDCSGQVQLFEIHAAVRHFLNGDPAIVPICLKPDYETLRSATISMVIDHYLNADVDASTAPLAAPRAMASAAVNRLDFSSPEGTGRAVTTHLLLTATNAPTLLAADVYYDPAQIGTPYVVAGPQAISVGKRVEYNLIRPGWLRILVYGINRNTIANGIVATLGFDLASGTSRDAWGLNIDASATMSSQTEITLASNAVANGRVGCSTEAMLNVTEAYIGYYNRCPDAPGMNYWCLRLDSQGGGGDLSAIISAFGTSQEYTERFSFLPEEVLINNLYQNMFERNVEPIGLAFYNDLLASHEASWLLEQGTQQGATEYALSRIALDVLNGAQGQDAVVLEGKVGQCQ